MAVMAAHAGLALGLPLIGASGGGGGRRARAGGLGGAEEARGHARYHFPARGEANCAEWMERLVLLVNCWGQPEPPITVLDLSSVLFSCFALLLLAVLAQNH
jgi:hypothetical protein